MMALVIEDVVRRWHEYMRGALPGGLDELLADDVVFYSPVVYTPQEGKAITKLYLEAAAVALPGDTTGTTGTEGDAKAGDAGAPSGRFRYTKQVMSGDTAILEFETTVDGKYVNGVDIIRCDERGRIVEFRVMVRPLQAVNAVHAQMRAMLESMNPSG
jgi:hypothetical protein